MGRRGPAAAPDNVRQLRGTDRHHGTPRRLKLPPAVPSPPAWLSREAKAEWRRVVPGLDRMGVLAEVDRAVLSTYCTAWARFVEAEARMRKDGGLLSPAGREGQPTKHPLWQVFRESANQVRDLAKELYLTPTARLRSELPQGAAGQVVERDEADGILD